MIENKQEKIDKIYKEIANKELSFGCKVLIENRISLIIWENANWKYAVRYTWSWRIVSQQREKKEILKIFWHPVMIGDVFDYIEDDHFDYADIYNLCDYWKEKTKPIGQQSEECIDYIYKLL